MFKQHKCKNNQILKSQILHLPNAGAKTHPHHFKTNRIPLSELPVR